MAGTLEGCHKQSGWRFSLGVWSTASAVAAVPWIIVLIRGRSARRLKRSPGDGSAPARQQRIRPWKSRIGWGLALVFAGCSSNTFAWLPAVLIDRGMTARAAGSMLALYAITALPTSLLLPLLVANQQAVSGRHVLRPDVRRRVHWTAPCPASATPLWVILAGLGQGLYSFALLMINGRTRTTAGSGALSGFAQGVGVGPDQGLAPNAAAQEIQWASQRSSSCSNASR